VSATGTLKTSAGSAMSGKRVTLQTSTNGTTWTTSKTATTTAGGAYTFTSAPQVKTFYRVLYAGDSVYTPATSLTKTVLPQVYLTVPTMNVATPRVGASVTYTGYLKPKHVAGAHDITLHFQRLEGGVWKTKRNVLATNYDYTSGGVTYTRYSLATAQTLTGSWRVRAIHATDATNYWTGSAFKTFTVSP
jgi:hypothetical protein